MRGIKGTFPHSGIVLVDKPKDWTSHDVVNFVRRRFSVAKVGHCGTLDPAATGLLVIVLGHATKMSQQLSGSDKTYEATILFGKETDSQDMDGQVISEKDCSFLTEETVRSEFAKFAGEMEQIPPMVSAVKIDGKRLYELARAGKEVEREPKKITIHSLDIKKVYLPYADFVLKCTKGTYVRTICSDMGRNLGCGAVLFSLRRTVCGEFNVEKAVTVETMKTWEQDDLYRAIVEF
ncbi:MAG: tRNA pseudouridine(55) synthase TruB [Victivallales bacterium]